MSKASAEWWGPGQRIGGRLEATRFASLSPGVQLRGAVGRHHPEAS